MTVYVVVNFAVFQVGWFSSVLGGAAGIPWVGPVFVLAAVLLHLHVADRPASELMLILACALIGTLVDSTLVAAGWVTFPSGMLHEALAPYWIVAMWVLFATTLNSSLRWLRGRTALAVLFGAVGGPVTYAGGHELGGIDFLDRAAALAFLGVAWGAALPVLTHLAAILDGMPSTEPQRTSVGERS